MDAPSTFKVGGILGLSPNLQGTGVTFLQTLKDQALIANLQFSLFLGNVGAPAMITFGGYDSNLLFHNSSYLAALSWYSQEGNYNWQLPLKKMTYQGRFGQ